MSVIPKITLDELLERFGWNEEEAKLIAQYKKDSFPADERARRRKVNKRARLSRKVNREQA